MFFKTCIRPGLPVLSFVHSEPVPLARTRRTSQILFREREKNVLGIGRDLMSGLGTSPVDRLSKFVPLKGRLMPQQLTALTEALLLFAAPHPLHNSPLDHLNPLHALRRWITIVWAKTAPHLDSPSSTYAYIYTPPFSDLSLSPKP